MFSGWTKRNFEKNLSRLVAALIKNILAAGASAPSYLVAPQRMQLLVIAKGERVNCDENQMIEVVNVTGMRCYRLTTTIAIIFEMRMSAA